MTAQALLWEASPPAPPPRVHEPLVLRPHQTEAVDSILDELRDNRSTLLVMATGLGKTAVASGVIRRWDGRALFIAHRDELIRQGAQRIARDTGLDVEIEKADEMATVMGESVVVASIQTLAQEKRLNRWPTCDFSLVIVDEAHHCPAETYKRVLAYFSEAKILGLTATPDRADRLALGAIFESVAHVYDIENGIKDGWLSPLRSTIVQVDSIRLDAVKTTAGDLNPGDLDAVMATEENLHGIVRPTLELAGDRRTLVFTTSVENAKRMAEVFCRYRNDCARSVDGAMAMDQRRRVLADHQRGAFQFLVNVGIATEGYDDPAISCVAMGRPTKSRALYTQMVGRGTRITPGKTDLLILDFSGNAGRHRLVTAQDILAGRYPDEVVDRAKRMTAEEPGLDVRESLARAEEALQREKEEAAKEALRRLSARARVAYSTQSVNPFAVFKVEDPEQRHGGQFGSQPASEKQLALLGKFKIPLPHGVTAKQANTLIGEALGRRKRDLCSFGQMKVLNRYGFDCAEMPFKTAGAIMDALAKNNWRPLAPHQRDAILGAGASA